MCGICGYIDYGHPANPDIISKLIHSLHHRGPDDSGYEIFNKADCTIVLGHSRLSILDISNAGHQPMTFGNLCIVLNGEIYNFREIRSELIVLGHNFYSESDTEVILHSFSEWGVACISRFIGMFAFVILNKETEEIVFARDRAGVKPLFYYWENGLFLFASELKAFHQHPGFVKRLNHDAVGQFMDFGYISSPGCIFENCNKLEPGHFLTFKVNKKEFRITKYWDVRDYYILPTLKIPYKEALEEVERLLLSAFEYRLVSDVPVGVFLSGGYDSTALVSILQHNRSDKLKTFTIGFKEGNNEAPFAKRIAQYLGTDHFDYYCSTKEAQDIVPNLPDYFDEPFADDSAIPTVLVSRLARKDVTVALSADAGDEIFAGYDSYRTFLNNLSIIDRVPQNLRKILSIVMKTARMGFPDNFQRHKLSVFADLLMQKNESLAQNLLRSYLLMDPRVRRGLLKFNPKIIHTIFDEDFSGFTDRLSIALATDYRLYLADDILTKVDRSTMSVSLEGREPFLDQRIIEFVAQLPNDFKYGYTQKMILKDIVYKHVPKEMIDRPKTGFTPPIFTWLKNELSYLLDEYLNQKSVAETELFNTAYVGLLKEKFKNGRLYDQSVIWKLLQFQMWYARWMS